MKIKILFMDVDGTLTDGSIYIGNDGEVFKCFNVKDGYGIHNILKKYNVIPAIITGRSSKILEKRCKELQVIDLIQESKDKVKDCKKILQKYGFSPEEAAFIGDDMNDFDIMNYVAIKGCPADAVDEIKHISNYITSVNGGHGAVREFIEWLMKNEER